MAKEQKSFIKGRMNKSVDERLLPEGEYVDALNIRLGSTELSEIGAVENSKGNVQLTELKYNGVALSNDAVCIGAFDDSAEETMYWFVHDPNHSYGGVVDMIVSFNVSNNQLVYHVVTTALLNFNPTYLVNGINKIDDLLFFTDDYNQPRKINVTRGYPYPVANVDQIVELDISVIKPQPTGAPVIELQNSSEDSNHIRDTFISFAYRYKYKDGEYSALSQFSDIAFTPDVFYISDSNMVNDGMTNQYNSVKVSLNTGPENVVGIDVVYKESDSNLIYVAKKIDKGLYSLPSNFTETITFSNNEIYTILSEPELLRLYDNVPRLAKAQTIMGNRVMYGNYLEGRDIVDDTGSKVDFNYETSLFSRVGILDSIEYDEQDTTSFTYNLTGTPLTKQSSSLIIETSGKPVDYYSSEVTLNITMVFESLGLFSGSGNPISYTNFTPVDTSQGDRFIVNFNYTPNQDYQSAYQAYNTNEFKDKTGENGYEQLPSDWEIDSTLTGRFNFLSSKPFSYATNLYPDFTTLRSARDSSSLSDFIKFEVLPNGDIHLVPNALQFEHPDASNPDTTDYYVFYKIKRVSVSWSREIGQRSLHSNRDYQIGILYEDSEGRYSPVFESNINSVFIPASKSDDINSIKVTIPSSMKAPSWASRYKFLAKQNKTDYETIFSTKSYIDDDTGRYWVLLDGEQSNKVSVGQELIVKKDGAGPTVSEVITTVLDVKSLPTGDLYDQIAGNFSPSGVYASMSPDGWNIEQGNLTTFTSGQYVSGQDSNSIFSGYLPTGYPADIAYPVHDSNGDSWRIQSGDVVNISFSFVRRGDGNACGDEICFFNERYISSGEYADLRDFWIQQPVDLSLVDCSETNDISGANQTTFDQNEIVLPLIPITNSNIDGVNQITFGRTSNNRLYLVLISGSKNCGRRSIIKCKIEIVRNSGLLVFETNPTITNNDIYFENEQSFPIVNGYHLSGDLFDDQDQSAVQDGIVNLSFFNCFTFLNGVESYKFKDSLTGKKFYLGQRVTSVSDEDYKEIRREASITYSGVYNEQSNINRTNEFNLGLANYKDCEISYGPIQVLHGRSTDLLTLQEDRISYVSLGKNLLVAADGGGVLTSVPEVLGTQVARIEEYGISNNPESFTHYGSDIYFTDAKRSAVIQLKGGSKSESLSVISNVGMRSWFRDLFQTSFSYQKLGGYDPYMDEYVLSPNTNELPSEPILYDCGGLSITFNGILTAQEIEVNAGSLYGNVTVFVQATNEVSVTVTYNGVTTTPVTGTGSLNVYFDKDVPTVTTFTVTITPIDANPLSVTELFTGCPIADTINIVPVVLTSGVDQGDTITNAFGYTDATVSPAYTSPFVSSQVQFLSPSQMQYVTQNIVSQYGPTYTAQQGSGSVPIDGSTGIIVSSKTILDTFVFDDSVQSFSYLRTNNPSLYTNTEAGINQLLADSLPATTSGSAPIYSGLYTMPAGADDDYLFLIWDYRQNKQLKMCYSNTSDVSESCCECFSSPSCIPFLGTTVELTDGAACALSPTTTYYTSSLVISGVPNTQPILGTTVYSNLGCSSGNTVSAGFIKLADNTWVETDSNGEVISVGNC